MLGIRGFNPIWTEFDLTGHLFDDTFYLFVLENTIPYIPANVYHDPDLNVIWTNPIQFLANGTLPVDIYFEQDMVYRLEFRQGTNQADPLIYEVNNYVAGTGGSTPVDTIAIATTNQVSNPQFSIISFVSPYTVSATDPDPIEVAPGWFLEVAGSGSVEFQRVALNDAIPNPSNAPYALRLTLSGWSANSVFLRQRFQQNGMLWANKIVSSTITARLNGSPQSISATLVDSNNDPLAIVLPSTPINETFNEYTGYGTLPATTNPDLPPAAYIDYKLALPSNIDIYVTSFQLIVQDLPIQPPFEQDTIDRQIDHTFHNYRDSILFQSKDTILTAWNFPLNPWQFATTTSTNIGANQYITDQTIAIQQHYVSSAAGNNIQAGTGAYTQNFGLLITASTATNVFGILQYIDSYTIQPYWGYTVSSLVKVNVNTSHGTSVRVKMRLIYRSSLPPTLSQTEPVSSWTVGSDPSFSGGWTAIAPENDSIYTLSSGVNEITFDNIQLPAATGATMTLGVMIYTLDNMDSTGTADALLFDSISLVRNDFSIDTQPQTYAQVLKDCQFYYEKSYDAGILPGTASNFSSAINRTMGISGQGTVSSSVFAKSFHLPYLQIKRTESPVATLYSPNSGTAGLIWTTLFYAGVQEDALDVSIANWLQTANGSQGSTYVGENGAALLTYSISPSTYTFAVDGIIYFHYTQDARLGLVA